ncbi:hypothetical protein [Cryptosporangium minutisporangium]|uniref:TfoX N-terminal domain-containing protein n=1 Tax=Cryptosporangium minutisporangium TaxID=113569 RepID=A0ABP6TCH7_9ACTN
MSPDERFDALVDTLMAQPDVTPPGQGQGQGQGFGSGAVRYRNRIFAMFVRGRLVVKLPKPRVDALVDAGEGTRFDANKGTPMKEWLALDPDSPVDWGELAEEALDFAQRTTSRPSR